MTEKRAIPALAPRRRNPGAAAALSSANRTPAAPTATTAPPAETKPTKRETQPNKPASAAPASKPKATGASAHRRAQGKVQIAVDIPEALRGRARTAFKHANFHGGAASFSEFVTEALEAKVRSVEHEHNGGDEFDADESNLRSGRPTGG